MPRLRLVIVPVLAAAAVAVTAGAAQAHTHAPARDRGHALGHAREHADPQFIPLHAQPNDHAAVVGRLARGDRFTTRESRGGWTFITDRTTRAEGWVRFAHPHRTLQRSASPVHD
jgi:hypothetical protein